MLVSADPTRKKGIILLQGLCCPLQYNMFSTKISSCIRLLSFFAGTLLLRYDDVLWVMMQHCTAFFAVPAAALHCTLFGTNASR
jgi:hypothetical protein